MQTRPSDRARALVARHPVCAAGAIPAASQSLKLLSRSSSAKRRPSVIELSLLLVGQRAIETVERVAHRARGLARRRRHLFRRGARLVGGKQRRRPRRRRAGVLHLGGCRLELLARRASAAAAPATGSSRAAPKRSAARRHSCSSNLAAPRRGRSDPGGRPPGRHRRRGGQGASTMTASSGRATALSSGEVDIDMAFSPYAPRPRIRAEIRAPDAAKMRSRTSSKGSKWALSIS